MSEVVMPGCLLAAPILACYRYILQCVTSGTSQ
jgi:hypothetical protein